MLESADIYAELSEVKDYLQRRAPRKVAFDFKQPESTHQVRINRHLFAWVVENLVRNSLDAMDGRGTISCEVYRQGAYVCIGLSDTGHGYSTKKRGWGLGLSLARRIIEEYHKGKIFVKGSRPNELTTFTIMLPAGPNGE